MNRKIVSEDYCIDADDFECHRDWLHQVNSELIQLEDQQLSIENGLNNLAITEEDVQEILEFVEALPACQQQDLVRYAVSSRLVVNEKKQGSLLSEQLIELRQNKIKGHFRNRVISFSV